MAQIRAALVCLPILLLGLAHGQAYGGPVPSSSCPSCPVCPAPSSTSTAAPAPASSTTLSSAVTVTGAGSTALQSFLQNVLGRAQGTAAQKVSLPYNGVGSGAGQTQFLAGTVDYGVSDVPFTTMQYMSFNRAIEQIPAALNTVSVFVNITGVSVLKLDANTLARIFLGQITSFNDPAVVALNPGITIPTGNNISVIVRGDGSGTTDLFSGYLAKAAPSVWRLGSGLTVAFPANSVRAVTGTNSVVAALSALGNSIGYSTSGAGIAAGLTEVALQNANGQFLTSVQANYDQLVNNVTLPTSPTGDWSTVNLTYVGGNATYPIAGLSYYFVNADQTSTVNGALLKQLMAYLQTADVQTATGISGLRPLPARIEAAAMASVAAINAPATPNYSLAFSKPATATVQTG